MSEQAQRVIERMWERFKPLAAERVGVLADCAEAAAQGRLDDALREQAALAAHSLAGSLGSYGLPEGSRLARAVEADLLAGVPDWARLTATVAELRAEVSR
ncbi:MAG: Hpt domain-containing protein [Kineosporiaceae bacterium]